LNLENETLTNHEKIGLETAILLKVRNSSLNERVLTKIYRSYNITFEKLVVKYFKSIRKLLKEKM